MSSTRSCSSYLFISLGSVSYPNVSFHVCRSASHTHSSPHPMPQFFVFSSIIFLEVQAGVAFGLLISSIIKNVEAAPKVAPVIVVLLLMFSGFFLNGLNASCCSSGRSCPNGHVSRTH